MRIIEKILKKKFKIRNEDWWETHCGNFKIASYKDKKIVYKILKPQVLSDEEKQMQIDKLYMSIPEISGKDALWKLIKEFEFNTVLDLGAGEGIHSRIFLENGKKVTAISGYDTNDFDRTLIPDVEFVVSDYLKHNFDKKFDCIWACHILEHQLNIGLFLNKVHNDLSDNGILAVTVPPYEVLSGGGHINFFAPGQLIYQLLMAGFDLRDMRLKKYGHNLSIICKKNPEYVREDNNFSEYIMTKKEFLPDYVVNAINEFTAQNPCAKLPYGAHERIPESIYYKW